MNVFELTIKIMNDVLLKNMLTVKINFQCVKTSCYFLDIILPERKNTNCCRK